MNNKFDKNFVKNKKNDGYNPYKDVEEDKKVFKKKEVKKSTVSSTEKLQNQKKFEKTKKAIQKQNVQKDIEKKNKVVQKKKRTNNIDWTKIYEDGIYDEDDFSKYL